MSLGLSESIVSEHTDMKDNDLEQELKIFFCEGLASILEDITQAFL